MHVFSFVYADIQNEQLKWINTPIFLLCAALPLLPSQSQLHQLETRPGCMYWVQGVQDAWLAQGVYLHHLPHAPAPAWIMYIGFSCSAETLASAAATAPADSCDQKVPLNPLQQLRSICDHWFGDRSCSVCQLLFPLLVKQGHLIIQSVSIRTGDPLQNKQMAQWLRHSFWICMFPKQFEASYIPCLLWLQIHKITILSNRKLQEQINLNVWDTHIQSYEVCASEDEVFASKSSRLFIISMISKKANQLYTKTQTCLPANVKPPIHTRHIHWYY